MADIDTGSQQVNTACGGVKARGDVSTRAYFTVPGCGIWSSLRGSFSGVGQPLDSQSWALEDLSLRGYKACY